VDVDSFASLLTATGRSAVDAAVTGLDAGADPIGLSTRLRRDLAISPELCAAALTQAALRRRGRAKFGPVADRMWFTPDGLEQSTRSDVAAHRATRFATFAADRPGPTRLADLCCGIGADLIALAATGASIVGVERDPLTAAAAEANATEVAVRPGSNELDIVCADVESFELDGVDAAYIDPSRRSHGRRTFDVRAYSPRWGFVTELLDLLPAAAKLAPGIPHDVVPLGVEMEFVSDHGDLKEAVLWSRELATQGVRRRATVLPSGAALTSAHAAEAPTAVGPVRRYLYEPDPAVVRAHLVGAAAVTLDATLLDASTAYLSGDSLVASPFARAFEVSDVMPFSLKRLRELLRHQSVGAVTIMKRGSAVDVEQLRRDLRLEGDRHAVVVLALVGGSHHAIVGKPVTHPAEPAISQ
jgi:SAM-dependent methyltransferase